MLTSTIGTRESFSISTPMKVKFEIGDYNQSSLADFFRSHLMSEKEAKSYTGEKVHYSYIQRVASLYIAAFLIMYSLFLIHKSIPVIQSPKITF